MKRSFNPTKLAVAMASVLGAMATPTFAVNLSDNGLGDVGLVPYYTVRNNIATNISVVNTSDEYVVAFKIRFREGDNTRDARDFNVFLSPNDVWTATVAAIPDGDDDPTNDVPVLMTSDQSCTAPILQPIAEMGGRPGIRFTNIAYAGGTVLPADTTRPELLTIERAQEGHFEVIEMGVADPDDSTLAAWAVHRNGAGEPLPPANCAAISAVYLGDRSVPNSDVCDADGLGSPVTGEEAFTAEYCEPLNVLKVSANLIRVDMGVAAGLPVDMLANFYNPNGGVEDPGAPDPDDLMRRPDSARPDLNDAEPTVSAQITEQGPLEVGFTDAVRGGADAVSSLFMATDVINEYGIGGAALAQNAWVVTFPTKNFYVDTVLSNDFVPFQEFFQPSSVSCVTVDFEYYDREENTPSEPTGELLPSPRPEIVIPPNSICKETQTLNFGDVALLGSKNNYEVPLLPAYTSGWMRLGFPEAGTIEGVSVDGGGAVTFTGLPVQGFSIKSLENGVAGDNTLNYGIISEHAYLRQIDVAE